MERLVKTLDDVDDGLWYQLRSSDRYLYHYTTASVLSEHLLKTEAIRFSSLARLNDPYEFRELSFIWSASRPIGAEFQIGECEAFSSALRRDIRVACFSADAPESEIPDFSDAGRILSAPFRRGHSLPQMWAHYGGQHSGACLIFDRNALRRAFEAEARRHKLALKYGRVDYRDTPGAVLSDRTPSGFYVDYHKWRRLGTEEMARRHVLAEWRSLYLLKTAAWSAEQEYRWLLFGSADEYVHCSFGNALVAVMLGERFPTDLRPAVIAYAETNLIRLADMDWINGYPQPKPVTR